MESKGLAKQQIFGELEVRALPTKEEAGREGAQLVRRLIQEAVEQRGTANVVLATGNSQLPFLKALISLPDIEWERVRIFHLDEYVGISDTHPASFVKYVRENVVNLVNPLSFYPIRGDATDPATVCSEYEALLREHPVDVCCLGIGENGHIAFNEPHDADFEDEKWVRIIALDDKSRSQQVGEGHFASVEEVPKEAITLTIPPLLAAKNIVVQVPEGRKAPAVRRTLHGPISTECPASILRTCSHARLFLDADSAAEITWG